MLQLEEPILNHKAVDVCPVCKIIYDKHDLEELENCINKLEIKILNAQKHDKTLVRYWESLILKQIKK